VEIKGRSEVAGMEETVQWGQNAETAETKSYLLLWDDSRVCCRGLYCVAVGCIVLPWAVLCCRGLYCVAVGCIVLPCAYESLPLHGRNTTEMLHLCNIC